MGDLPQHPRPLGDARLDVGRPVLPLDLLCDLHRHDQWHPGGPRGLDRPVGPLVGAGAPEEEQEVLLPFAEGIPVLVDPVVDDAAVAKLGHAGSLGLADGHEPHALGHPRVELLHLRDEGAVERVNDGHVVHQSGHQARPGQVLVEDVEAGEVPVDVELMHGLVPDVVDERRPRGGLEHELQPGLGLGIAGGEQGHLVAAFREAVGQERHHPLDPAVELGWDRDPGGRDLGDPHVVISRRRPCRPRRVPSRAPPRGGRRPQPRPGRGTS